MGVNRSDISAIVEAVYDLKLNVLAFDFRGHGESDGHTITYGQYEQFDVLGAYDFCLAQADVDHERLYALGVSMGGSSLLLALPSMPLVRAAVVDSLFADLKGMIEHQMRWFPHWLQVPLVQMAATSAWIESGIDVQQIRPIDAVEQIECPVTLIHGQSDFIVLVTHSERLSKAIPHLITLYSPPNVGHIGMVISNSWLYSELIKRTFSISP